MTLDEAIKHAREKAEEQRKANDTCLVKEGYGCKDCAYYYSKPCIECAEEHEQLAEWLEEYKKLKSIDEDLRLKYCYEDLSDADNLGYLRGYNEAIDDLTNKLTSDEFQKYNLDFVFETSKSLSYNECISAFCEYIEKIANKVKECTE